MRFIKYYSMEIYSVITVTLITMSAIFVSPDTVQKLVLAFALIFLLHEWEERDYPGGLVEILLPRLFADEMPDIDLRLLARESRLPASILLMFLTLVPYIAHEHPWTLLLCIYLGIFEGIIHVAGIRIFKLPKPYTPGLVTAECELILSAYSLWYIISSHQVSGWQYVIALIISVASFMLMQSGAVRMIGIRYRDVPKLARKNIFGRG